MTSPGANFSSQPSGTEPILRLKLYIAGDGLNSLRALANLRVICEEYFTDHYQLEVIDIFDNPLRAISDNVLMTPMLVKYAPPPEVRLAGDLSEQSVVIIALRSGWSSHD